MDTKYFITATFLLFLLITGCNDLLDNKFEEINTNPNEPVEVDPNLLLPYALEMAADDYFDASVGMEFGNLIVQYWARVSGTEQDRYIYSNPQFSGLWNSMYADELMDFNIITKLGEEMNNPNYQAIGMIMKSWSFSVLTDSYGDIPYSEALKGIEENITKPKFDLQQDIYHSLIKKLDDAQGLIVVGDHTVEGDILYNGDMMKWKKFANSLRFRLLMRISNKEDVSGELQTLMNNDMMFTDNSDNAKITFLSDPPNRNPLMELPSGRRNQFRMSQTFIDRLKELKDPRLEVFADTTSFYSASKSEDSLYVGVPNGMLPENLGDIDIPRTSMIGSFFRRAETPGFFMTVAELNLLKAEAAQRNLISGSAKDYYEQGIAASLDQFELSGLAEYLAQDEVSFNSSTALQKIGDQMWISLFGQGLEAWNKWRRTGYPNLQPSVGNDNNDQIPVRMEYPFSLESTNSENYEDAISRQGINSINTPVWWDK